MSSLKSKMIKHLEQNIRDARENRDTANKSKDWNLASYWNGHINEAQNMLNLIANHVGGES